MRRQDHGVQRGGRVGASAVAMAIILMSLILQGDVMGSERCLCPSVAPWKQGDRNSTPVEAGNP